MIAAIISVNTADEEMIRADKTIVDEEQRTELINEVKFLTNVFLSRALELQNLPFTMEKQMEILEFLLQN